MKLTLHIPSLLILLLLLVSSRFTYGQQPLIHVELKEGKIIIQQPDHLLKQPAVQIKTVHQRTERVNGITLSILSTDNTTCGDNNGSIVAIASGGTAPYIYDLDSRYPQNTGNFPTIYAGTHIVNVRDANGQTASTTVTISNSYQRPSVVISGYQNASTCTSADASVNLAASGGTAPYQYSVDGIVYQSSNVFAGLHPGVYTFLVKDANGCIGQTTNFLQGTFYPYACQLGIGVTYSPYACGNTGSIRFRVISGPAPPYRYSVDGVTYMDTCELSGIGPGIQLIYYKGTDQQVAIAGVSIFQNCTPNPNTVTADAGCTQSNGTITVTAGYGTAPHTYTIDGFNYQAGNVFTGLPTGNYFVTVKDANGLMGSAFVFVSDNCPGVTLSAIGETCLGNDGTITAAVSKGTAPFQYSIDAVNFQSSNLFSGLVSGTYTVTVKDALGFTADADITVPNSCLTVSLVYTHPGCGNNNGSITATAANGNAPYQYSIDGITFQLSNTFNGLAPGTYTVSAKDYFGKFGTATAVLVNNTGLGILTGSSASSCSNNDGSLTINGSGGTPPYLYSLDGITFQSNPVFTLLPAGLYTAWIKDTKSCVFFAPVTIVQNCPLVSAVAGNETCGSSNGTITASAVNGTAPYQFSIDAVNFQSNSLFTGITAGTYTVTVKDAAGIKNTTTVTVKNICPVVTLSVTNGLCGTANAVIDAAGTNGTAPYLFSIDGISFQSSTRFTGLASGTYTITVKDANGLTGTAITTVQNFPGPQTTAVATAAFCLNNDGTISINAIGGAVPVQFSLDGVVFQSSNRFTAVTAGSYTVYAKDVNGCQSSAPILVSSVNNLVLTTGNPLTICEGEKILLPATSNGTGFKWTPAGGLSNQQVLNPQASPVITSWYYITATLGVCNQFDSILVNVNAAPVPDAGKDTVICYGQPLQLNASGGLIYSWSPSLYLSNTSISNPLLIDPHTSVQYHLAVTDQNGCTSLQDAVLNVNVTAMSKLFAGNDTSIILNQPFQLYAADINNSGFTQYTWAPPTGLNNRFLQNPVATAAKNVTYVVTGKTAQGCTATDEITIKVFKGPEIYVPSGFTPNKDGLNDFLKAIPVGIKEFRRFAVFNRWGQMVFITTDANAGWDGMYKQVKQDPGMFAWIAEGIDEAGHLISRRGTVILIR